MGKALSKLEQKLLDVEMDGQVGDIIWNKTFEDIRSRSKDENKLVVLQFKSSWSQPCQYFKGSLDELARNFKGKARFYSLDVDLFESLARFYGVEALPTFVLMRGGRVDKVVGIDKEAVTKSIQKMLGEANDDSEDED